MKKIIVEYKNSEFDNMTEAYDFIAGQMGSLGMVADYGNSATFLLSLGNEPVIKITLEENEDLSAKCHYTDFKAVKNIY